MAHDITYFAIGAGLTGLVLTAVMPRFRYRLTVMTAGGVWATIPLLVREFGLGSTRIGVAVEPPYSELFWFHHTVSAWTVEVDFAVRESDAVAAIALMWLVIVIVIVEVRGRIDRTLVTHLLGRSPTHE